MPAPEIMAKIHERVGTADLILEKEIQSLFLVATEPNGGDFTWRPNRQSLEKIQRDPERAVREVLHARQVILEALRPGASLQKLAAVKGAFDDVTQYLKTLIPPSP